MHPTPARPDGHDPVHAPTDGAARRRAQLSALADGDLAACDEACAAWAEDPAARKAWHRYHLIGDVLRSDDLAQHVSHDEAFLARLRGRLQQEPVVLAPQTLPRAPAAAPRQRRAPRWVMPVAAAAGFVAVAGVLVVTRLTAPVETGAGVLAGSSRPAAGVLPVSAGSAAPTAPALVVDGQLLRDARLDQYLRAHREMLGAPAAAPGGGLRNVDTIVPQR